MALLETVTRWWREHRVVVIVLTLCVVAAYGVTLGFTQFVYDDQRVILRHPVVRGPWSLQKILWTDFWGSGKQGSLGSYRPVVVAALWLEYQLWGTTPFGYHVTQLLWMLGVSVLVVGFARSLGLSKRSALFAGVLFALHPAHTDNVASIAGRADLMAACFFLLALSLHRRGGWKRRLLALLCVVLGLGSKELFAVFVGAVFLLDWWGPGAQEGAQELDLMARLRRLPWLMYGLYLALTLGALKLRVAVTGVFSNFPFSTYDNPLAQASLGLRWLNVPALVWHYFWILVSPTRLAFDRTYKANLAIHSPLEPTFLAGVLVLLGLVWMGWRWRERALVRVSLGLALVFFFPLSNTLVTSPMLLADRWLFFLSIPFCVGVVALAEAAYVRLERVQARLARWVWVAGGLYALLLLGITAHYAWSWRSPLSLYAYGVQSVPENLKARDLYGRELLKAGRLKEAKVQFQAALAIKSNYLPARFRLAQVYERLGELEKARRLLYLTNLEYGRRFPEVRRRWLGFLRRHPGALKQR